MNKKDIREIVVASAMYSLGSIFGPILVFVVPAYFFDKYFDTSPVILLFSVLVAFIFTNILLYKKVSKINKTIFEQSATPLNTKRLHKNDDESKFNS